MRQPGAAVDLSEIDFESEVQAPLSEFNSVETDSTEMVEMVVALNKHFGIFGRVGGAVAPLPGQIWLVPNLEGVNSSLVPFGDSRGNIAWLPRRATEGGVCCSGSTAVLSSNADGHFPHFVGDYHMDGANIVFWDGHNSYWKRTAIPPERKAPGIRFDQYDQP